VWLGLLAGYFGGWTERVIMRLADMQLSIPLMLFALIIIAALGPSLPNLIIVLAMTGWTRFARITRGEVLSLREREFVLSARAAGARPLRILLRHILPNALTAVIVLATLELARVVILESALSFLGLGVQPPQASWGRMLADGRGYIATAWWLSTFPGLAIVLVVLGVNLLGDWMRDYFDPKLSEAR
jgi:peptide/nickel transport system permease protein